MSQVQIHHLSQDLRACQELFLFCCRGMAFLQIPRSVHFSSLLRSCQKCPKASFTSPALVEETLGAVTCPFLQGVSNMPILLEPLTCNRCSRGPNGHTYGESPKPSNSLTFSKLDVSLSLASLSSQVSLSSIINISRHPPPPFGAHVS